MQTGHSPGHVSVTYTHIHKPRGFHRGNRIKITHEGKQGAHGVQRDPQITRDYSGTLLSPITDGAQSSLGSFSLWLPGLTSALSFLFLMGKGVVSLYYAAY